MNIPIPPESCAIIDLPASKSILNRALLLAALGERTVKLVCGALCGDTRTMIGCLHALGVSITEEQGALCVRGCGGKFLSKAEINVQSAGTAARFLPAVLSFCKGEYLFTASEQMRRRPMDGLLQLENAGVEIDYLGQKGAFPFRLRSGGVQQTSFFIDTEKSTQFASGLLLAACALRRACTVTLSGNRTKSGYLQMTIEMLRDFGYLCQTAENTVTILPQTPPQKDFSYAIEADVSAACYFCALALLCKKKVFLRGVHSRTKQGDFAFIDLLKTRGLVVRETCEGLYADGRAVRSFRGFDEDFGNFSDQALTAAALAPFAETPSRIKNISHIRYQECDRIKAAIKNLNALGVPAVFLQDDLLISPASVRSGKVETFHDHRVAMAFSVLAKRAKGVEIDDLLCTEKTFENFSAALNSVE